MTNETDSNQRMTFFFQKRTRANPTPATMEERVQNKENTTRALVDGDTQANNVKVSSALHLE